MSSNLRSLSVSRSSTRSRSRRDRDSTSPEAQRYGVRPYPAIRRAAMPFPTLTRSHRLTVVCPVFDLGGHVTFYERTEVLPGRRTVDRLSHLKWGILSSSMPN